MPVVAARGPLCTASFFRGVTPFLMDLMDEPDASKRLLDICTDLTINWLKAQAEAIGPCVEGILVLDDIVGMIGEKDFLEFGFPYFKDLYAADAAVKFFHNDAPCAASIRHTRTWASGFSIPASSTRSMS